MQSKGNLAAAAREDLRARASLTEMRGGLQRRRSLAVARVARCRCY